MKSTLAVCTALLVASPAVAAEPVAGRWITEDGKAVVAIGRCGDTVCGRIDRVLVRTPGQPTTDVANPDPKLRSRPFTGLTILSGFVPDGKGWKGRIYNPQEGKTYRSVLTRAGDTLQVKGCIAFLCKTQTWKRAG